MRTMDDRDMDEALEHDSARKEAEAKPREPFDMVRFTDSIQRAAMAVMGQALKLASDATKRADVAKEQTVHVPAMENGLKSSYSTVSPAAVDYVKLGQECVALAERAGILVNVLGGRPEPPLAETFAKAVRMTMAEAGIKCYVCGKAHEGGCPPIGGSL